MNDMGLFANPKWDILRELAITSQSPTTLAKKLQTSIPNVLHHLKLLEAHGIIASSTKRVRTSGKPPTYYRLANPIAFMTLIDPLGSKKKILKVNSKEQFIIRSILRFNEDWSQALILLALSHQDLVTDSTAIAMLNKKENKADLLLITKDINVFRTEKTKLNATINHTEYSLTVWSHTGEEYEEGIKKNEAYFIKYLKAEIIHDPTNFLNKIKNESA